MTESQLDKDRRIDDERRRLQIAVPFMIQRRRWTRRQSTASSCPPSARRAAMLKEFAALEKNWNSYGADPFGPRTLALAHEVSNLLGEEWKLVPCADGSLHFYRGNEDDTITVYSDESALPECAPLSQPHPAPTDSSDR